MAPEGHVLGTDYAGIVVEVGSEVTHVKKFDRVRIFLFLTNTLIYALMDVSCRWQAGFTADH